MDYKTIRDFPRRVSDSVSTFVYRKEAEERETDFWAAAVFVGAISALIVAGCYVIGRLSRERAYREKWNDYDDCGWA